MGRQLCGSAGGPSQLAIRARFGARSATHFSAAHGWLRISGVQRVLKLRSRGRCS